MEVTIDTDPIIQKEQEIVDEIKNVKINNKKINRCKHQFNYGKFKSLFCQIPIVDPEEYCKLHKKVKSHEVYQCVGTTTKKNSRDRERCSELTTSECMRCPKHRLKNKNKKEDKEPLL